MINRREFLERAGGTIAAGAVVGLELDGEAAAQTQPAPPSAFQSRFDDTSDRVWLGPDYWANPMEDWRVARGRIECISSGGNRNVHLLTRSLAARRGAFELSVRTGLLEPGARTAVGFRIAVHDEIDDYRGNCIFGNGLDAGIDEGSLRLGYASQKFDADLPMDDLRLHLRGDTSEGDRYTLTLSVKDATGRVLAALTADAVAADDLVGNVALVNNFDSDVKSGARFWFADWRVGGDKIDVHPERAFGPILWAMYTVSDSRGDAGRVLKLTAQLPPLGDDDGRVHLHVQRHGQWQSLGQSAIDASACTAHFRIEKWDASQSSAYRLTYAFDGREHEWTGTIRAEPLDRPLVLAALTCQEHHGFPYAPVASNVKALNPDLLFFSGDQIYEQNGGYGVIRRPADRAILNYLRKWYLFGWAFGDVMRDRPTLCIPDDHDVFQGNLWGEGGKPMLEQNTSSRGGYIEPPAMVRVVHRTNCAHHPDPFDSTSIAQGISVYYGDMVFGRVSFAILADRQFKSGPEHVDTGAGRADHVLDSSFDTSKLDRPGLELLGERQEKFLEHWAGDWRGADLKVVLSQTPFTCLSTHGSAKREAIYADLDSNAWPQTPRNRALRLMRKGFPLHVNGDQHIPTLTQYGLDAQRDAHWSFCPPAISVGYPRWWRPDEMGRPHQNRPAHALPDTGEYTDAFGHPVYVYAVGNPTGLKDPNRYQQAHRKTSGFGIVRIDRDRRIYICEAYRFLCDATDGNADNQFPGWPLTIRQAENFAAKRFGALPRVTAPAGVTNPVVQVIDERDGRLVYALRVRGESFEPFVFADGEYTVRIGQPASRRWVEAKGLRPARR
ncbi:MAG TPA: alkaline phosphatase D family protein [Tepidisphaeraceae bacterium]|nr:alkaline phosphatase D family protein [Tepidisphaeraceae bacterium]